MTHVFEHDPCRFASTRIPLRAALRSDLQPCRGTRCRVPGNFARALDECPAILARPCARQSAILRAGRGARLRTVSLMAMALSGGHGWPLNRRDFSVR